MNGRLESCLCSICMNTSESCSNWTIFFLGTLHVQNILCDWCDKINYLRQDTRLCTAPFSTFKLFIQIIQMRKNISASLRVRQFTLTQSDGNNLTAN